MTAHSSTYLPAAGHDWALPVYDPLVKLLGLDASRIELLDQAAIQPGHRTLDIGCGTGTLSILLKRLHPDVDVVGLDPDPKALGRASRKADRASVRIQLDRGFADRLPYPDAAFDRVFSSFMFHHLPAESRLATLREARRVLKPGGSLHLVDFAKPASGKGGVLAHLLHSNHRLQDNTSERILDLMRQAGFDDWKQVGARTMFLGLMSFAYFRASLR